jgi:hypothetical protein
MALDTTLLTRNRVFGVAAETTTGTAAAIDAAACGVFGVLRDINIKPEIPAYERQGQQYLSKLKPVPGARKATVTFTSEVFANTGAPAWATILLPACGMLNTAGTFTPQTATAANPMNTATIGSYEAGRLMSAKGCAGTFKIKGKSGDPLLITWTFTGGWVAPTSTAIPSAITYPTQIPPRFAGATFTVGGTVYRISDFEFDWGATVYLREDPTDVSGYRAAVVTDRKPMIRIDPESLPLGTQDWYAAHAAATTYAFDLKVGTTGNAFELTAPVLALNSAPEDKDSSGLKRDQLEFVCAKSAGDDEVTMIFS